MNNDHIPTSEVLQDIRDTKQEIVQMEREEKGYRIAGTRWDVMRANSRVLGIKERKEFIGKLENLLSERENKQ